METPPSMRAELAHWNNGAGVDLAGYVSGMGNYRLAVGYCTVFWPRLVLFEGYILREGVIAENVRQWEDGKLSRAALEWLLNHAHLADIHMFREDTSKDKLLVLGAVMSEMLEAKLRWQFPDRPCKVAFDTPADEDDLTGYQVSFWQVGNEILTTSPHLREPDRGGGDTKP